MLSTTKKHSDLVTIDAGIPVTTTPIVRTFKKGLVRAFFEIAKQLQHRTAADLNDPDTLRGLLLNYSAEVKTLRESVSEQAPVVKAFHLLETATDGSMCITDAAKQLQVRPKDLFSWLNHNGWTFRRGSVLTAYQQRIQQGVLECKLTHIKTEEGRERVCLQVFVTPKGLGTLAIEMQQPIAA